MPTRYVTLVLHRDDATSSRAVRLPLWLVQLAGGLGALAGLATLAVLLLYAPLVRSAARVPMLERQVRELEAQNAKIHQLAAALDSVEATYAQVRSLLGATPRADGDAARGAAAESTSADAAAAAATADAALAAADTSADPRRAAYAGRLVLPALRARRAGAALDTTARTPVLWPLDVTGYVTRGASDSAAKEPHPGIDVAVPTGTPVRTSAAGVVRAAGEHPEYGQHILVAHDDGHETLYGHLSRVLVQPGDTVVAGRVVGLSGNSGRSSAPHLHFEVRRAGRAIDPLTLVKEPR